MLRKVNLDEISDGKVYKPDDLVKVGCDNCAGCSACCETMCSTIILDPFDMHRLTTELGMTFEDLMVSAIELNMNQGLILPNLKENPERGGCFFLNQDGRCDIHSVRPQICRMFPLGRIFTEDGIRYVLQTQECKKQDRTKVKVRKWLDTPDLVTYEKFSMSWHCLMKSLQTQMMKAAAEEGEVKRLNMSMLTLFYLTPFQEKNFYQQFEERCSKLVRQFEPKQ